MENTIETFECPYCEEEISANSKKCKHGEEWVIYREKVVNLQRDPDKPCITLFGGFGENTRKRNN